MSRTTNRRQHEADPWEPVVARRTTLVVNTATPTWREALVEAQGGIAAAKERRREVMTAAHAAGVSYGAIGRATGLSGAAISTIVDPSEHKIPQPWDVGLSDADHKAYGVGIREGMLAAWALEAEAVTPTAGVGAPERKIRLSSEDREVTELLTTYDRAIVRLAELGVDVKARDRANNSPGAVDASETNDGARSHSSTPASLDAPVGEGGAS
jgi:hypothetical protein